MEASDDADQLLITKRNNHASANDWLLQRQDGIGERRIEGHGHGNVAEGMGGH